jgi:hypothetical protein
LCNYCPTNKFATKNTSSDEEAIFSDIEISARVNARVTVLADKTERFLRTGATDEALQLLVKAKNQGFVKLINHTLI